ncbi:purine-nucleoside phosphorylase [Helcococcus ovis]|uniref:Uridine phosphorylase n=1 Tax=Helcococcus ovis TaxID=72026 RepID=A0A4V3IYE7_9FIRM|nr:purine-nucleoside phosphorylase [Helcococcus ovis]TFF66254.1 purine-nucleoside phosphorylase [Helcococcus ovis]TFF67267.1 purine-nucleoside phosphorylase [Helcococcus ovis]TFF68375.1 purine-nucleoside phosphorylase [Helcococcus ovis]WNZ00870.1 purine-nucleoside phosphorylase [Helcococcus ovis]
MIPTPHIGATSKDQIADTVLMPGDPKRAKFIADTFLENVEQFNDVRGMLGFTGTYKGKRVSVMGSGMGIPSAMIYYHELFVFYDVKTIIRVGTAGGLQPNLKVRDIIVATAANTPASVVRGKFGEIQFSPTATFDLVLKAHEYAKNNNLNAYFGTVLSSDEFYRKWENGVIENLIKYQTLGIEMEAAGLYMSALENGKQALCICTVSDNSEGEDSAEVRERAYTEMMEMALEIA